MSACIYAYVLESMHNGLINLIITKTVAGDQQHATAVKLTQHTTGAQTESACGSVCERVRVGVCVRECV